MAKEKLKWQQCKANGYREKNSTKCLEVGNIGFEVTVEDASFKHDSQRYQVEVRKILR